MLTTNSATYHEGISCVTCGNQMVYCGTSCSKCQTPMEVSKSVVHRGTPSRFVTVLGASGAGKTVYLGLLLDMLSQGRGDVRGLPNGAFSVAVQEHTVSALENRRFPEKTPSEADRWNWVHCEAHHKRRPKRCLDLVTPDLAGEAIALEMDQPGSFPAINNAMRNSRGVIMLVDSEAARDNGRSEDMFATKLVTYLAGLQMEFARSKRRLAAPLAIVFTKADCCSEAAEDPLRFAKAKLPGTVQVCKKKFIDFEFFAASVVGSTYTDVDEYGVPVEIPLHVTPKGVLEPLEWLFQKI